MTEKTPVLSSTHLFNFTKKFDILKIILQKGFRYTKWKETLPKSNFEQENYMVCFCDIPWIQNQEHRNCYGNNGIVLSKEWGIREGISPVRYINGTSVGMTDAYLQRKTFHREMLQQNNYDFAPILLGELIMEKYIANGRLNGVQSISAEIASNATFRTDFQADIDAIEKMETDIINAGHKDVYENLNRYILSLVETLYDELEHRDAFERNYKEDFYHKCSGLHPGKILYNEREWRSVKFLDLEALKEQEAPDYLPESENLMFTDDDVVAILAEKEEYKEEIKDLVRQNKTLLSPTSESKVFFVDEYQE